MATLSRDPRTIVTPDAFSVHPSLLGTPLASPSRRGVALLIDIFLVALITTLTSGFWFILGVVAAAFFFTRAKKEGKKDRRAKVLRFFLGCMGVMALSVTALVFFGIRYMSERPEEFGPFVSIGEGSSGGSTTDRLLTVLRGFQEFAELRSTSDPDEAVALAVSIGRRVQGLEPTEDVEGLLRDIIPEEVGRVDGGEILARAIVQLSSPPADDAIGVDQTEDLPSELRLAEAIEMAGDTIGELEQGLVRAQRDLLDARADLEDTRADLDVAVQRRGLIGWFTSRKVAGTVVIRDGVPKVPGNWDRQVIGSTTQRSAAGPA